MFPKYPSIITCRDRYFSFHATKLELEIIELNKNPTYGTSTHYTGDAGVEYFKWQDASGAINGQINARKFARYVGVSDHLLDFGCGGGHLINALAAKKKIGVEINPIALESAGRFCDQIYATIEEVENSSIDVVISNHAMEHVPYPILVLKEINRILKPNGRAVICIPIDDWRTQKTYNPKDINHHLNTWTPQLFGNSLVEAGFSPSDFEIKVLTHAWFPQYLKYWKHERLFDFLCTLFSIRVKRRQLIVVIKMSS